MPIVNLSKAIELLNHGTPVALPTETVYGLAAPIDNLEALQKIFLLKQRPLFDPLIVHVADKAQAADLAKWDPLSSHLAEKLWPGPLSLVLKKTSRVPDIVTSGGPTVALRCPAQESFREILRTTQRPLAAPSANRFGKTSPTLASHVVDEFNDQISVVDGGACDCGIESTVAQVDGSRIMILRPGLIGRNELLAACQDWPTEIQIEFRQQSNTPGHLANHYQPDSPLVLVDRSITIDDKTLSSIAHHLSLTPSSRFSQIDLPDQVSLAARELYGQLRKASAELRGAIICTVDPSWPADQSWLPLWDRLNKACQLKVFKNAENQIIFEKKA